MDNAEHEIAEKTRKIIVLQVVVGLLVAAGFYFGKGGWESRSALYGAFISIAAALLLRRGIRRAAAQAAEHGPKHVMLTLYMGAVQRFVMVLALFGLGLAVFKLAPLATIAGFGAAQLVYLAGASGSRTS